MSTTWLRYEAEAWGTGELWLDGTRLLWHELPRPARNPHPGWGSNPPPSRSTVPGKDAEMGDGSAPRVERLVQRLEAYFRGEEVSFADVQVDEGEWTPFQADVAAALRQVSYGEVLSYSDLARAAGYPRAQRAAGTFCAGNRYALVIPCHRVVGATGIGSYGSLGIAYKRRLLALEGVAV